MMRVVAALILREDRILICQRTPQQAMPLRWEFPGGKAEPGEALEAALRRELEEELGILAEIGPEFAVLRHEYPGGPSVELHFFFVATFVGRLQNRIFHDLRWVTREEMPAYEFLEADVALVRDLAAGKFPLTSPPGRT